MSVLKDSLSEKLSALSTSEFDYIETNSVSQASQIGFDCSGIFMESTIIYFEIKNLEFITKESGRRKAAMIYTMFQELLSGFAKDNGGFVNCFSSNAFLVIFPGGEDNLNQVVTTSFKIAFAINNTFKDEFSKFVGLEFGLGIDHGHILGTKTLSDNDLEIITWFGSCINKAQLIAHQSIRPFYVSISSLIFHNLDESLKTEKRHILGIPKTVELWTKNSYNFENTKKHFYQSNYKIPFE